MATKPHLRHLSDSGGPSRADGTIGYLDEGLLQSRVGNAPIPNLAQGLSVPWEGVRGYQGVPWGVSIPNLATQVQPYEKAATQSR